MDRVGCQAGDWRFAKVNATCKFLCFSFYVFELILFHQPYGDIDDRVRDIVKQLGFIRK
jgi:hypothetical protein